ncbi:MAG: hypothetical protein AAGD06_06725 [Acidobacteriota bacterium]
MRADVTLITTAGQVPGELTTEHPAALGEPVFLPWRSLAGFLVDQPYLMAGLGPVELVLREGSQRSMATSALALCPEVRVVSVEPWGTREEVSVATNLRPQDHQWAMELARRDGVSLASWVRSALLRELTRRPRSRSTER